MNVVPNIFLQNNTSTEYPYKIRYKGELEEILKIGHITNRP